MQYSFSEIQLINVFSKQRPKQLNDDKCFDNTCYVNHDKIYNGEFPANYLVKIGGYFDIILIQWSGH